MGMKLGTETGSLMNHIFAAAVNRPEPKVGMGATILMWTDRHPATIVRITPCQVHVREDTAVRVDNNGMSESQDYIYEPDLTAPLQVFRATKHGWKNRNGNRLAIGDRQKYHDYSF